MIVSNPFKEVAGSTAFTFLIAVFWAFIPVCCSLPWRTASLLLDRPPDRPPLPGQLLRRTSSTDGSHALLLCTVSQRVNDEEDRFHLR